jgi:hypothetical protein
MKLTPQQALEVTCYLKQSEREGVVQAERLWYGCLGMAKKAAEGDENFLAYNRMRAAQGKPPACFVAPVIGGGTEEYFSGNRLKELTLVLGHYQGVEENVKGRTLICALPRALLVHSKC